MNDLYYGSRKLCYVARLFTFTTFLYCSIGRSSHQICCWLSCSGTGLVSGIMQMYYTY